MRLFKPTYRDKTGGSKTVKKWWVELRDHLNHIRRFPAFNDKGASMLFGQQIQRLVNCKVAGEHPAAQLTHWLENVPKKLRAKFVEIGLLDPKRTASGILLTSHLEDFRRSIGDTTKHAKGTYSALLRTFKKCGIVYWSGVRGSVLWNYLQKREADGEISQRTFNFYLKACKQFARWMVQDNRAISSPIAHLKCETITKRSRERRAVSIKEARRLLEVTEDAPERFGMTGYQRALLYRLAIETGLRASELRSLTVSAFNFKQNTVIVEAGHTKNKKIAVLPLKLDTSLDLRNFTRNKISSALVFNVPEKTALMFRADLVKAKIDYTDEQGRVFDFHSLRHQTGTLLAASGVHPKDAQQIMRHSDVNLTMNFYTHTLRNSESAAVNKLPDLSTKKTGKGYRKNLA